jgi:hypothetical protein
MATQWKLRTIVVAVGMALVAPVVVAKTTGHAQATANSSQMAAGSFDFASGSSNSATINRHVLQNAKGNIGVNIAGGAGNMQVNNTDIALANGALTKKTSTSSLVENMQWSNMFSMSVSADVTNSASASNHVLQNASGNVGLNVAAGADNMQANNTALSEGLGVLPSGVAKAGVESLQISGPWALSVGEFTNNTASLSNHVLQNASGNVGVNVAAGDENMGVNNLAVAYNRGGVRAASHVRNEQFTGLIGAATLGADNDATLSNHVLQNASGNIGANVAAGEQNMQSNALAVSTAQAVYPNSPTPTTGSSRASVHNAQGGPAFGGTLSLSADNDASLSNHVLQNASGNIGVNAAAGEQNMQANNTALAIGLTTMASGVAGARVENRQNLGVDVGSFTRFGDNDASLSNHVLQNATGNIGANVASGTDNMQANNLAYAYNNAGALARSAIDNDQGTEGPYFFGNFNRFSVNGRSSDMAHLRNHVLQNASGNIGVNVAAGELNEQGNSLALSNAVGAIPSATTAVASIADNQISNLGWWYDSEASQWLSANGAGLSNDVLQNATGNIGVNAAAGLQNTQANNTAIALGWGIDLGGPADAAITGSQESGPWSYAMNGGSDNSASVRNHVLQNASGKIGANVAAGMQNMQSNDLAYAFNRGGSNATAFTGVSQVSLGTMTANVPVSFCYGPTISSQNTAVVSNHVMQNASGDIGLNVAAGAANMQRNTLTIADAD